MSEGNLSFPAGTTGGGGGSAADYPILEPEDSARNLIVSQGTGVVPLVIRGILDQAVALQEWQRSTGTPVVQILIEGGNGILNMVSGGNLVTRLKDSHVQIRTNGRVEWSTSSSNLDTIDTTALRHEPGVVRASDGSGAGSYGAFMGGRPRTARTADLTLDAIESGRCYTNAGAAGTVVLTLPPAVLTAGYGPEFLFVVHAAQTLRIKCAGTDVLRSGASATTAGGQMESNAVGFTALVTCSLTGVWTAIIAGALWAFT